MIKLLNGMLVALLVIGCAMEEPDTSGALTVNPSTSVEVPDGMTAKDVDLYADGTIDIKDLVIVSKFFGQDVPEADAVAEASGEADESDPCRDIQQGLRFPQIEIVNDNAGFKETFPAPDGNRYAYALVAVLRTALLTNLYQRDTTALLPMCLAMRFLISGGITIKDVKIKPVAQQENMFSRTIEMPLLSVSEDADAGEGYHDGYKTQAQFVNYRGYSETRWRIGVAWNFISDPPKNPTTSDAVYTRNKEEALRMKNLGIPIGDSRVIYMFEFLIRDQEGALAIDHHFRITGGNRRGPIERFRNWIDHHEITDSGGYIKMLPAEVRRRYFPEDIE